MGLADIAPTSSPRMSNFATSAAVKLRGRPFPIKHLSRLLTASIDSFSLFPDDQDRL